MIDVAIYNREGAELETLRVDEGIFGGCIRYPLLKQSIVMYQANKRLGTATNKSRGKVEGSTRKLYRQKGTGNARAGMIRTPVRVGGGVTFGKTARDFSRKMPKKQRRLARDSAILAKLQSGNVVIVQELDFQSPKTKEFARILGNLKINRSCLVAVEKRDENLLKSVRNVPCVDITMVFDLNAGDICNRQKMLFTKEAFLSLLNREQDVNLQD
jgi:large subunit ribosomal protein L4